MNNFIIYSEQDPTIETTEDNVSNNDGFHTSNAGDIPINIEQDITSDTVSGHVVFNQAGSCTQRKKYSINGTNRQKHMIQKLCSTIPRSSITIATTRSNIDSPSFLHCCGKR